VLLPFWVASLAAGAALQLLLPRLLSVGFGIVLGALGVALVRSGRRVLGGASVSAALGLALIAFERRPLDFAVEVRSAIEAGRAVILQGRVRAGPVPSSRAGASRLAVEVERIAGYPTKARLALSIASGRLDALPDDVIETHCALHEPTGLANPGLPDERLAALARGVDLQAGVGKSTDIRLVARGRPWSPRRLAHRLHVALARVFERELGPESAAFAKGVVLGERSAVGTQIEAGFKAAGATHVLSVSGLHLAAVGAACFLLLRRLARLSTWLMLRCDADRVASLTCLPLLWTYTLVTGEAVATWRSLVMVGVALGAIWMRRALSTPHAIALAALFLLIESPLRLLDISFQLSFASVVTLAINGQPRARGERRILVRAAARLCQAVSVSAAAALATAPLLAHHFGEIAPAAPIGNLLLVPLVEVGVVPLGLFGGLLGAAHPVLGALPIGLVSLAIRASLAVAALGADLCPLWLVRSPGPWETGALTVAALLLLAARRVLAAPLMVHRMRLTAVAFAAVAGLSLGVQEIARRMSRRVAVTFLDVGQGDAAVILGPRGFVAVIDGGGTYDGSFDPGARVVEPFLRRRGVTSIDLVALSHPHPDHLNGLQRLVGRFPVRRLWTSGDHGDNPEYLRLLAAARAQRSEVPTPRPFEASGLWIRPLAPLVGDVIAPPPGTSVNDASLVLAVSYAGRSILFTGDLELDGEEQLVARFDGDLSSDVLKVPHHGSRTSSTAEFLAAARPQIAVMSLGRHNRFGFPRPEVVARYAEAKVRVLRTDRDGAVTVEVRENGAFHATCERTCRE
jgi:competence protein ComEC